MDSLSGPTALLMEAYAAPTKPKPAAPAPTKAAPTPEKKKPPPQPRDEDMEAYLAMFGMTMPSVEVTPSPTTPATEPSPPPQPSPPTSCSADDATTPTDAKPETIRVLSADICGKKLRLTAAPETDDGFSREGSVEVDEPADGDDCSLLVRLEGVALTVPFVVCVNLTAFRPPPLPDGGKPRWSPAVAANTAAGVVIETMRSVERTFSPYCCHSELTRLNRNSLPAPEDPEPTEEGHRRFAVSDDLHAVLSLVDALHAVTGGRLDPSVAPASQYYATEARDGLGPAAVAALPKLPLIDVPPSVDAVAAACGWGSAFRVGADGAVSKVPAAAVDLSAVAKGHCVDVLLEALVAHGFRSCYIDWGGDIRAVGSHPTGRPWCAGIRCPPPPPDDTDGDDTEDEEDPEEAGSAHDMYGRRLTGRAILPVPRPAHKTPLPSDAAVTAVELQDAALCTSGDYAGVRPLHGDDSGLCHVVDPRTMRPLRRAADPDAVADVTVVHDRCAVADAWATTLLMCGTRAEVEEVLREAAATIEAHLAAVIKGTAARTEGGVSWDTLLPRRVLTAPRGGPSEPVDVPALDPALLELYRADAAAVAEDDAASTAARSAVHGVGRSAVALYAPLPQSTPGPMSFVGVALSSCLPLYTGPRDVSDTLRVMVLLQQGSALASAAAAAPLGDATWHLFVPRRPGDEATLALLGQSGTVVTECPDGSVPAAVAWRSADSPLHDALCGDHTAVVLEAQLRCQPPPSHTSPPRPIAGSGVAAVLALSPHREAPLSPEGAAGIAALTRSQGRWQWVGLPRRFASHPSAECGFASSVGVLTAWCGAAGFLACGVRGVDTASAAPPRIVFTVREGDATRAVLRGTRCVLHVPLCRTTPGASNTNDADQGAMVPPLHSNTAEWFDECGTGDASTEAQFTHLPPAASEADAAAFRFPGTWRHLSLRRLCVLRDATADGAPSVVVALPGAGHSPVDTAGEAMGIAQVCTVVHRDAC